MNNLIKYISLLGTIAFMFSACASKHNLDSGGYRYVSFEEVPRGEMGKLTGKAYWNFRTNHIAGPIADSFHVYGNFDSIRFLAPRSSPNMFRKTDIRAESWKAKPSYGKLHFVGNFTAEHLPGIYEFLYYKG